MARRKRVKRGIPSVPAKKVKSPPKSRSNGRPYTPAILDYAPVYDVPTATPTAPLMTSVIVSNQQQRQNGGGWLIRAGNSWRSNDPRIDAQLQAALIDIGVKLATLTPLGVRTLVQASSDSDYHLAWAPDPLNDGGFLITLSYPPDADITGGSGSTIEGAHATTLSPGSSATASIDSSGIIQIGVPRGADGSDGSNGLTPDLIVNSVTALSPGATPTFHLTAELPTVGATTIPILVDVGLVTGATGETGAVGGSGVVSVANVDQDSSLPDTLEYNSSTKVVTLKRPLGQTPQPPNDTAANICDVSTAVATRVLSYWSDFLAKCIADIAAGTTGADLINLIGGEVPVLGQLSTNLITLMSNFSNTTVDALIADTTTDAKTEVSRELYCIMTSDSTKIFNDDIRNQWQSAIFSSTSTAFTTGFALAFSLFLGSINVNKIAIYGQLVAAGSGDCASYDCGGGTSTGTWCHVYDFTTSANGFTGFDLEGNGSVGVWVSGVGFRASANSDGNSYGDIQGDLPAELHVTTVRIQGTGSNNGGGAFGCWLTGPHAATTTPTHSIPGAGAYDITLTVNDLGNHLKVFHETAHYADGVLSTISSITLVGTGDYPTSFNNC